MCDPSWSGRIIDIAGLNARLNGNLAIILHLPGEVGTQYEPVCLSSVRVKFI